MTDATAPPSRPTHLLRSALAVPVVLALSGCGWWTAAEHLAQDALRPPPSPAATAEPTPERRSVTANPEPAPHASETRPCPNDQFECVTLTVPRDHATPADGRTVSVTFAIREAVVERRGAFLTITGGPGTSGINAGPRNESEVLRIGESYDLVFMDQRGIGLSGRAECGGAAGGYDGAWANPDLTDSGAITAAARSFVGECLEELGSARAEDLMYATTEQTIHDIEALRRHLGDDQLYIYGEGYGTYVAQAYAVAYPDHLGALFLDAPIDPTVPIERLALDQALAAEAALDATLGHCGDGGCSSAFEQADAIRAYDGLASRLSAAEPTFEFPTPVGFEPRSLTLGALRSTTYASIDTEWDRTLFLRAFDAANGGDLVLLARQSSVVRSAPDDYSTAAHYAALCGDHPSGSGAAQRPEDFVAHGVEAGVNELRMAPVYYDSLPCAYWPSVSTVAPDADVGAIRARDFPVFILSSTIDPVAPPLHARQILQRLGEDAYLIEMQGGGHVSFGQGYLCVDRTITEFLLDGSLPPESETACPGVVAFPRQLLPLPTLEQYGDVITAFYTTDTHIYLLPEFVYWRGTQPLEIGCDRGGSMTFMDAGTQVIFEFEACTFIGGLSMTGDGSLDWQTSSMTLVVDVPGGHLTYSRRDTTDASVEGTLNGEVVDEEW